MEKIIDVLSKLEQCRTKSDRALLFDSFSNFSFFQDLVANDESNFTFKACVNALQLIFVSKSSSLASAVYVVLKGTLEMSFIDFEGFPKIKLRKSKLYSLKNKNTILLETGSIFGNLGRSSIYNVSTNEECCLAMLSNEVYESIQEKQELLLLEKIDLLKDLPIFRNWSRKAFQNAAKAFEKISFKKGELVYREGVFPDGVYIVASGEFRLIKSYKSDSDSDEKYEFGSIIKRKKVKDSAKKSELQVIIKQKEDIFGLSEILESKNKRDLSCVCHSNFGEVLFISEKEFSKKFSHPEILKNLEQRNKVQQKWTNNRILNLELTEKYKEKLAYTPKSLFKLSKKIIAPVKEDQPRSNALTPTPNLPKIFENIFNKNQIKRKENSFTVFKTEIPIFNKKNSISRNYASII